MIINTTCSDCAADVRVDVDRGRTTTTIPSNGVRGKGHVPAHVAATDNEGFDEALVYWICPACGYSDSSYLVDE